MLHTRGLEMCVLLLVLMSCFFEKYGYESWYWQVSFIDFFGHVYLDPSGDRCVVGARWASHRTLHMLGCGRMMDNNVHIPTNQSSYCQRMMKGCPFCWKRIGFSGSMKPFSEGEQGSLGYPEVVVNASS